MIMSEASQAVLERLFFVTERLLVFDSLDDVFTHILRSAKSFNTIDAAAIQTFDLTTGHIRTVKTEGLSDDYLKYAVEKIGEGIGGRVIAEGKPFFTNDVTEELYSDHRRIARENGLKTAMAIPLKTKAGCVGCLTVFRKTDAPFLDEDIIIMSIFASIAAEAIEKRGFIASF
jgi:Nif-specific regulatory protein